VNPKVALPTRFFRETNIYSQENERIS